MGGSFRSCIYSGNRESLIRSDESGLSIQKLRSNLKSLHFCIDKPDSDSGIRISQILIVYIAQALILK